MTARAKDISTCSIWENWVCLLRVLMPPKPNKSYTIRSSWSIRFNTRILDLECDSRHYCCRLDRGQINYLEEFYICVYKYFHICISSAFLTDKVKWNALDMEVCVDKYNQHDIDTTSRLVLISECNQAPRRSFIKTPRRAGIWLMAHRYCLILSAM